MTSSSLASSPRHTLASLPKSWRFTSALPPDQAYPTPAASHASRRDRVGTARLVRGALFTWIRPEPQSDPELLAVSPAAVRDLGLDPAETSTDAFLQTAAGNKLWGWYADGGAKDNVEDTDAAANGAPDSDASPALGYPWAQCYGGFQFGQWAGQLGDGRAISLFEAEGVPGRRFEIQLKGAGTTPYSRFADGLAVLRSSLREFVASEALNALGIPSTRALALVHLPDVRVHRERLEPGAIVVRMAPSWLRLGTFDLLRARGDRVLTRRLAEYAVDDIFGGWEQLPAVVDVLDPASVLTPARGLGPDIVERVTSDVLSDADAAAAAGATSEAATAAGATSEAAASAASDADAPLANRFARFYREVVRRNAYTVARWQVYGFLNGVLNTDNTSLAGLSLDFGPFAFLDHFDPAYTPNHDDHALRYSYRNQPSVIWWNLVRFGEALGELLAAADRVDHPAFSNGGILGLARLDAAAASPPSTATDPPPSDPVSPLPSDKLPPAVEQAAATLAANAETIIMRAGDEFNLLFLAEYRRLFLLRLGLPPDSHHPISSKPTDMDPLIPSLLDLLQDLQLDFHLFFRRLSALRLSDVDTDSSRLATATTFFYRQGLAPSAPAAAHGQDAARHRIANWLAQWHQRLLQSGATPLSDDHRIRAMKEVNPNFVPRGWILDELIRRVEHDGERDVLRRIMHMTTHPFADAWHGHSFDGQLYEGDSDEERRWTDDVPETKRAMQCSCSS